jgi:AcrR family transcriptional regulator
MNHETAPDPAPRRRKSDDTRDAILAAARALFAEVGYQAATVREIAARAGADPALVIRYFGGKEALFVRVTDFDLGTLVLDGIPRDGIGRHLVRHFLDIWEGPRSNGALVVLLRTASTSEAAAARMRTIFAAQVRPAIAATLADPAEADTRAGLIASHVLGIALCRHVLHLPPVVAMSADRLIATVGRTLQGYLTAPLD